MIRTDAISEQSLEIFIDGLVTDEEFRDSFLRNPRQTLRLLREWGLPLSDSEMRSLTATDHQSLSDRIVDELTMRLVAAAA